MIITPTSLDSQKQLITNLTNFFMKYKHPAIFCVGNSNVIGDCFAPYLGELLLTKYHLPIHIYGRKEKNITSSNLQSYLSMVKMHHDGVLVIDSAFSPLQNLGTLTLSPYGSVLDCLHTPTKVGNYSILANVNTFSLTNLTQYTKTKKEMILHLLSVTSNAIFKAYSMANVYHTTI